MGATVGFLRVARGDTDAALAEATLGDTDATLAEADTQASPTATDQAAAPLAEREETRKINLEKGKGAKLGVDLGNVAGNAGGAVVLNIREAGLVAAWNKQNPDSEVEMGMIITEANGRHGYWDILEEIGGEGPLELLMKRASADKDKWQEEIQSLCDALRTQKSSGSLRLRFNNGGRRNENTEGIAHEFTCLPNVRAGDCGATQCSICIDDLEPEDNLVQLPCKHAFHPLCAARWLTQNQNHTCPLCVRPICGSRQSNQDRPQ